MISLVLLTMARFLITALLLVSIFLLLRGHHLPGGGFIAGLVASAAFLLYALAQGPNEARRLLRVPTAGVLALGLMVALVSGVTGLLVHGALLEGLWLEVAFAGGRTIEVGTPLLFDLGVFLVVVGAATGMLLAMAEE